MSRSPRRMKSEGRALGAFPFVNSFLFNLIFTFRTYYARCHSAIEAVRRNNVRGSGVCTFECICKGEGKSKLSLNALHCLIKKSDFSSRVAEQSTRAEKPGEAANEIATTPTPDLTFFLCARSFIVLCEVDMNLCTLCNMNVKL